MVSHTYADRQTYIHTLHVLQCSHASVGLAQARPNNLTNNHMLVTLHLLVSVAADDSELSDDDTGGNSPAQSTLPQRSE